MIQTLPGEGHIDTMTTSKLQTKL